MLLPRPDLPWPICQEGVALIATAESCHLKATPNACGVWTLGWGETQGVLPGMTLTQTEADQIFCLRLDDVAQKVRHHLKQSANEMEFAALVCLAHGIGITQFARSNVLDAHNRNDKTAAAQAFLSWDRIGNQEQAALTWRRNQEALLYLKPFSDIFPAKHSFPEPTMRLSRRAEQI